MSLDLLVPALAGYLLLRNSNFTRFGLIRESGQHLVFRSALVGLLLYAAGWIIAGCLGMPDFLESARNDVRGEFGIGAPGIWTLVFASVLLLPNLLYRRSRAESCAMRDRGDFLGRLIEEASQAGQTIELSLRDGKVYIGYVTESRIQRHGAEGGTLVLVPVFSGYRAPDTHELVLTTGYATLLEDDEYDWTELEVVIPRSEVSRARLFDIELYISGDEPGAAFRLSSDSHPDPELTELPDPPD